MNAMIAIALLAGAAAGGIVWFGWAFARNAAAARRRNPAPAKAETAKEPPAKDGKTKS